MPTQPSINQLETLAPLVGEIIRGNDRDTAMAARDYERSQELKDREASRRFIIERDKEAEQRADRRMRRQKILDLAKQGIELPDDATDRDIAKAEREHLKKRAKLVVSSHESDLAANDSEYQSAYRELQELANGAATSEEKQNAIDALLMSPEVVKNLSDAQRKQLIDAKSSKDPTAVVAKIAADIGGDYWIFPGKNPAKAQAFIDAYNGPLMEAASMRRQIKFKALNDKLNDISANRKVIQTELSKSYRENAEWLDEKDLKRSQAATGVAPVGEVFGPPTPGGLDPNDVMADIAKPTAKAVDSADEKNTGIIPNAARAIAGYQPDQDSPPVGEVAGRAADVVAATVRDAFVNSPRDIYRKVWTGGPPTESTLGPLLKSRLPSQYAKPATLAEVNAHRTRIGKPAVPTLDVAEARKFLASLQPEQHAMIRAQAQQVGMGADEIAAGDKLVQSGDLNDPATQNAIRAALILYQLSSGQIGQTPPIYDEPLAPLPQ